MMTPKLVDRDLTTVTLTPGADIRATLERLTWLSGEIARSEIDPRGERLAELYRLSQEKQVLEQRLGRWISHQWRQRT